jgi:hypothetical protein
MMTSALRRILGGCALLGAIAAAATIAIPTAAAATCPPPPTSSTVFASYGDGNDYVLANNGSFDSITGGSKDSPWALSGGASVVADGNPANLAHGASNNALALSSGSSALSGCTSAPMITSIVRFFVKSTGNPSGHLHVELLVNGGKNGVLDGGTITAGRSWAPTDAIDIPWAHPLKGAVQLQLRLTPVEPDASFEVDDVFIDPFCSR